MNSDEPHSLLMAICCWAVRGSPISHKTNYIQDKLSTSLEYKMLWKCYTPYLVETWCPLSVGPGLGVQLKTHILVSSACPRKRRISGTSVGIVTRLLAGWPRNLSLIPNTAKEFSLPQSIASLVPTQPPSRQLPGTLPSGVKLPGRKADHSPLYSTKIMNV
jgi:hypothetical protein